MTGLAGGQLSASGMLTDATPTMVWVVVLSFVFLECAFIVGLFLPGDSLLFAAGVVLATHEQHLSAWLLAGLATVMAVGGNQVGFLIGRRTGARILARKDGRILNRANLARARAFFDKWGFWSVVVARWLPWVRTLAPMIAGAAGMNNRRYITANTLGALAWVPTLLLAGYYGSGLLNALPWLRQAATIGSVAFFVLGTGYGLYRYRQEMRKPIDEDPIPAESH
ncbi:DedA family protein [Pseudonocardia acaciae]|uniref:DedA family protein n=1 Tax=Pseudonocardia acaciae TaxID=551276 RepID=UPI0004921770